MRSAMTNCVSISANDPALIFKNLIKSLVEALLAPSAIFDGRETAARLVERLNQNSRRQENFL